MYTPLFRPIAGPKSSFQSNSADLHALIERKPDSQNHVSDLVITRAEKFDLQDQLALMVKGTLVIRSK